jgi:hypothetical protein
MRWMIKQPLYQTGELNMPNKDGTGKDGKGSKSGGQRGNCPGAKPMHKPKDGSGEGKGHGLGNKSGDEREQPSR